MTSSTHLGPGQRAEELPVHHRGTEDLGAGRLPAGRPVGRRADFATDFPTPQKLWTIDDLGGWSAVDPALFDKDNGSITKIYKQATG